MLGSSLIWMIAVLSGTVYSAMSMSMAFQLPGVTALVTAFSLPALMIETFTLVMSPEKKSRCSLVCADTFCGVPDQSMPSYSAEPPKVYFRDLLPAIVGSLKTTAGLWPQSGFLSRPAMLAASV